MMATINYEFRSVLVTGAAGFVGSRAVKMLNARGVNVIALDNEYVSMPLPPTSELIVPIKGDIRDKGLLTEIFKKHNPEAVLHLAAVHHIPTCENDPYLAFDVNIMGTQVLLEAIENSECAGLAMASSGAVYDWGDVALDEASSPREARDVYSTTKLTNEYQLSTWSARTQKRAHVGRLFNTIGERDPNGHLIPDLISQISVKTGSACVSLGNTKPKRDYIYVDDSASGFVTILDNLRKNMPFEAFNICRGNEYSVSELVTLVGNILGVDVIIESDPKRFRKFDRLSQLGNPEKMRAYFGWSAETDLQDALRKIIISNA